MVVSLLAAAVTCPEFFDSRVELSQPSAGGTPNVTSDERIPRRVMTSLGKFTASKVGEFTRDVITLSA